MPNEFSIDVTEFNKAMRQYTVACGESFEEAVNKTSRDICLRTAQFTPKANKASIIAVSKMSWFPKMIAKDMRRRSKGVKTRRRKNEDGKTVTWKSSYTRAQARARGRKIIASRKRGIAFLKAGFAKAGQSLGGKAKKSEIKANLTKVTGYGIKATPRRLVSEMIVTYEQPTARRASSAERKVKPYMREAVAFKTKDMKRYINRKLDQRAKQFSGR